MRLSAIEVGQTFKYEGNLYAHDLTGRSGSGKVAVKNLKTGEQKMIAASAEVELASPDRQEVPDDNNKGDGEPLKRYGLTPLDNETPKKLPKVREVKAVEEDHEE